MIFNVFCSDSVMVRASCVLYVRGSYIVKVSMIMDGVYSGSSEVEAAAAVLLRGGSRRAGVNG